MGHEVRVLIGVGTPDLWEIRVGDTRVAGYADKISATQHANRISARQADAPARFWVLWHGSPVRLSCRPGDDPLYLYAFERHEEGYSECGEEYQHVAGDDGEPVIACLTWSAGRDCDGAVSREWRGFCPVASLTRHAPSCVNDPDVKGFPAWETEDQCARDFTAESMGY